MEETFEAAVPDAQTEGGRWYLRTEKRFAGQRAEPAPGTVLVRASLSVDQGMRFEGSSSVDGVTEGWAGAVFLMPDGTSVYVHAQPDGTWGLVADRGPERLLGVECFPGEKPHVHRVKARWERRLEERE